MNGSQSFTARPDLPRSLEIAGLIAILGTTLVIHASAFRGFFVQDDFGWLVMSRFDNLQEYLQCFFRFNEAATYRPLSQETFFWLGQKAFGMWPPGFHGVSLFTHLLAATLVHFLLRKFFTAVPCLVGTLFFAIHSAHFSSVHWISAFPEPLALVFFMATLILFIRFNEENNRRAYTFSLVTMALGMMSKESILTVPLVLVVYCALFSSRRVFWTIPHLSLSGLYLFLRATSSAVKASPYPLTFGPEAWQNFLVYLSWITGVSETILKLKLGWDVERSYPFLAAAFGVVVMVLLTFSRNKRIGLFSVIWFLVALQPVLYFSKHIYPYYLGPALAALSLILASALPPVHRPRNWKTWIPALGISFFSLWSSQGSIERESRWWSERSFLGRDILSKMAEVDRFVPTDHIAYVFGFGQDEFGPLQDDAAFKAYGFSTDKFILVGLDPDTPMQIRRLKQSQALNDYHCIVYFQGLFIDQTEEFRRNPEPFLNPGGLPAVGVEVRPQEIFSGSESLTLRVVNFDVPAIDLRYTFNGKLMPPVINWRLDENRTATVFVDESTRKGLYHFKAIRDSRNKGPLRWFPVDVEVLVR